MADGGPKPIFTVEAGVQDLGFGSVVAQESRQRLLNRDGTFNVQRKGLSLWASVNPFHFMLTISWVRFFALVGMSYIAINGLFAAAYLLCGPLALQGPALKYFEFPFEGAFFFSVQTLATIGYGGITPVGVAANAIVTFESLVGLMSFALVTGILFARFSRPVPKIRFSKNALIAPYRNTTAFEFRIANVLKSEIIQLQATVLMSRFEICGGVRQRRFYDLKLERPGVVFFPLSWTIVHPIDDESPLKDVTEQELISSDAEFFVLLSGMDETFSQNVQTRSSYKASEIVWNAKFRNIFIRDAQGRTLSIDVTLLDEIEK
jgi:inward rectifier potassium channel